jgi:murein DD-endopeptidase MepM/ murein hydrolase activator NlpD
MTIFHKSLTRIKKSATRIFKRIKLGHLNSLSQHSKIRNLSAVIKDKGSLTARYIYRYKFQAALTVMIVTAGISVAGLGQSTYEANVGEEPTLKAERANLSVVHHVHFMGEYIGTVQDPGIINQWVEERIKQMSSRYEHVHFEGNGQFSFTSEEVKTPYYYYYNNEEVIERLEEKFTLQASAMKLIIDGEEIGIVPDEATVFNVLEQYKLLYVPEQVLVSLRERELEKEGRRILIAEYEEDAYDNPYLEEYHMDYDNGYDDSIIEEVLELDQPKTIDVGIKQEIVLEPIIVHPTQVLKPEEIEKRLNRVRVEEKIHSIERGEVLGSIAQKYGLRLRELLDLNPNVSETSLLQIGQELVVMAEEPFITVVAFERVLQEKPVSYIIQTKSDPNMYRGDTRIEQAGKNGLKLVEYILTLENGRIADREVVHEDILIEPIKQIVVRGEKQKASRGDGKFIWPAVGGRVTSPFGMRWGRMHNGLDIAGVRDRTIKAADNGTVITATRHRDYGNYIVIDHDNGYRTLYAHLSSISVKRGDVVHKGDKIGVMGSTGRSTGIHLHFEIMKNGRNVNPANYVSR